MKLLLHIGTEKTGTTALQNWLHVNDKALVSHGIWFSETLDRTTNRKIATYARGFDIPDESFAAYGLTSPERHTAFRAEVEAGLAREVAAARKKRVGHFVISSEHCHSRLLSPEAVADLAGLLGRHFDEIEVVCVLRPQVDLWLSTLSTTVRAGGKIQPDAKGPFPKNPYFNYLELARLWQGAFPQLTLVPYKRVRSTIDWFCDRFGLTAGDFAVIPKVNSALDVHTIALVNNLDRPMAIEGRLNQNRSLFIEELSGGEPLKLGIEKARAIQKRFAGSNRELCEMFPVLTPEMLEPDWSRYDDSDNFDLLAPVPWNAKLSEVVVRLNVEAWIQRAKARLAEAELAALRGEREAAAALWKRAEGCLDAADQGIAWKGLEDMAPRVRRLRAQVKPR
ncbi:hypothetical protein HMH01_14140 [Halovulum dunhuangense]|uniref:Uncharacterized protein n=1 Tax=Halovulum dunhuangense TaxID=1505036 RepID=A0A849L5D9_9RHOB|nr:hypothetical protein [Halovulum dunhuangense]NNU81576.1 hypothetical protein [Halovulum dunhuangense]